MALTEEQKRLRLGKMTSSTVAPALGLTKDSDDDRVMATPIHAWMNIRGMAVDIGNEKACERGNGLESNVLQWGANKLRAQLQSAPFRQHPQHAWAGDSTDGLLMANNELVHIAEAKTVSGRVAYKWGTEGSEQIPNAYWVQCHWHLIHWPEVEKCAVPILIGGNEFEYRMYWVKRNTEYEGVLLQDAEKWHRDYVITGKVPPAEADDSESLRALYPRSNHQMMADTPEIENLAREKVAAFEMVKKYKAIEDEKKNKLRQILGEHEGVAAFWGRITYKSQAQKTVIDYDAILAELGASQELIERHSKVVDGNRPLIIKLNERKENE